MGGTPRGNLDRDDSQHNSSKLRIEAIHRRETAQISLCSSNKSKVIKQVLVEENKDENGIMFGGAEILE